MSNKVKPENVTGIVQTWSGEKFVRRAISSSIFSKTDISETSIMCKKNKLQKCDPNKCSVGLHVSHDKRRNKENGVVPVLPDLE